MPTATELVAHDRSVEEVRQLIGADALIYQDVDAMKQAVRSADTATIDADQRLDTDRRSAATLGESLHQAELRHSDLSGRRAMIRERLETEWRRPLDDLFASYKPVEAEDDALRAEAERCRRILSRLAQPEESVLGMDRMPLGGLLDDLPLEEAPVLRDERVVVVAGADGALEPPVR